jgi:hypothetical protein
VLPGLSDALPEARLNLVIFHLRRGDVGAAYSLVRDAVPATPQEYILKVSAGASARDGERAAAGRGTEQCSSTSKGGSQAGCFAGPNCAIRMSSANEPLLRFHHNFVPVAPAACPRAALHAGGGACSAGAARRQRGTAEAGRDWLPGGRNSWVSLHPPPIHYTQQ